MKKSGIFVAALLTLASFGLSTLVNYSTPQPQLELTILQWNDIAEQNSQISAIIQNDGTGPAKNILFLQKGYSAYSVINYTTSESLPKISNENNELRIEINRISPNSNIILDLNGKINSNFNNTVSLFSDSTQHTFEIPTGFEKIGITSKDFLNVERIPILVESISGFGLMIFLRFLFYHYSNSLRKQYLGIYNIPLVNFKQYKILYAGIIILVGGFISFYFGYFLIYDETHRMIQPSELFLLNDEIGSSTFIDFQIKNAGVGSILQAIFIMGGIAYLLSDFTIPKYYWNLKQQSLDTVHISQIQKSLILPTLCTLDDQIVSDWKKQEIFVIHHREKVIGLLASKEVRSRTDTCRSILFDEELGSPKFNHTSYKRNNFIEIRDNQTLGMLKSELEKLNLRYAVVYDENEIIGIADYYELFSVKESSKESEL